MKRETTEKRAVDVGEGKRGGTKQETGYGGKEEPSARDTHRLEFAFFRRTPIEQCVVRRRGTGVREKRAFTLDIVCKCEKSTGHRS